MLFLLSWHLALSGFAFHCHVTLPLSGFGLSERFVEMHNMSANILPLNQSKQAFPFFSVPDLLRLRQRRKEPLAGYDGRADLDLGSRGEESILQWGLSR